MICINLCPYTAISYDEEKKVAVVNEAKCGAAALLWLVSDWCDDEHQLHR